MARPGTARMAEPGRGVIRPARPDDVAVIHRLVRELAEYERSVDQVAATEEDLRRSLFGRSPRCSRTSPSTTARWPGSRCGS